MVADHLRSPHLDEVRTGIAGHGVVGVLRGGDGDRVVALRADIDALPIREESGVDFASTVVDEDYPGGPYPVSHTSVLETGVRIHANVALDHLTGAISVPN